MDTPGEHNVEMLQLEIKQRLHNEIGALYGVPVWTVEYQLRVDGKQIRVLRMGTNIRSLNEDTIKRFALKGRSAKPGLFSEDAAKLNELIMTADS